MTANTNLERRVAEHYATEAPLRAPDWVLLGALATIDSTPQRRGLAGLRRYFDMPTYVKLAAAAVILIAVGGFALWQLTPAGPGRPPTANPSPTPASSPTVAPTAPGPSPYVPPELTETFTSDLHGLSLSYPTGWTAQAATQPWTEPFAPQFGDPAGDFLSDPDRDEAHLFIAMASQPLGDTPFDDWLGDYLADEGCTRTDPIVISGADEAIDTSCDLVLASSNGRGYALALYASDDDLDLRSFDAGGWFEDILATVELRPGDAAE